MAMRRLWQAKKKCDENRHEDGDQEDMKDEEKDDEGTEIVKGGCYKTSSHGEESKEQSSAGLGVAVKKFVPAQELLEANSEGFDVNFDEIDSEKWEDMSEE